MARPLEHSPTEKHTTLQKTLTSALNELGFDPAIAAIMERENGPLVAQGWRGFSARDVQAILRALSLPEVSQQMAAVSPVEEPGGGDHDTRAFRVRMITPAAKLLLAVPLRYRQRAYGLLVVGRKESAVFSKKEKTSLEGAGEQISSALERASLFDGTVLLRRSLVADEPVPVPSPAAPDAFPPPSSSTTPHMQERVVALLNETASLMPFDRAWITAYDPIAGVVEVLGLSGEHRPDSKRDLKAGQRLALDASASGWTVRHRKPRVDHDLASTQGRFQDHKPLYKDHFQSALVVPFFVRGQVGGTIAVASKTPMQYSLSEVRTLEPLLGKLAELIQGPSTVSAPADAETGDDNPTVPVVATPSEPMIRKQERQAAIGEFSAFLATEVREPLASIRAQLEEVTGAGILDFDSQTRVENAMRDLIRVEAILHEILDFAKPLVLNRRICRIPEIIEHALTVVATELDVNRIQVSKDYGNTIGPARCDDGKMQQVFLSIFKNALEAMTPGGHLHIEVAQQRGARNHLQITIQNDGVPIPIEHVGKVFEPYFTTKRSGTGLGLATVKKIVEEHHGQISIASGPGQGTAVIIRLPAAPRPQHYRGRGRGRRPLRGR